MQMRTLITMVLNGLKIQLKQTNEASKGQDKAMKNSWKPPWDCVQTKR